MKTRLSSAFATFDIGPAFAFGVVLSCFGCTQEVGQGEETAQVAQDLYLTGATWPLGSVFVCLDTSDGNNPPLVAEAQRVLADSWGRAANIIFPGRSQGGGTQANWDWCDYTPRFSDWNYSTVAISFCSGSSNSPHCPASLYDRGTVQAGAFRGMTVQEGRQSPQSFGALGQPGVTSVSLISDDPDPFLTRFRYEVIHELGHALGFEHEQDRPDNFDSTWRPIFCSQSYNYIPGGTYETPFFDSASVMSYCARDPLTGSNFPTLLSGGDVLGVRNAYSRGLFHGFMIRSDRDPTLAVNAFNGAAVGTAIKLHNGCLINNPDCTWSYQRGMIVSDTDPSLAIAPAGGASEGAQLKLTRSCQPSDPDCTWTYKGGEFLSDRDPTLAINALNGAQFGTQLVLTRTCAASNPDCTWQMPHVMLSSNRDSTLAVNAVNGASNGGALKLHNACDPSNPDCTWTFKKNGMIFSDSNSTLAVNALFGARQDATVGLTSICTASNPDCTWTWTHGELISDNRANGTLPINAVFGAVHLANLKLNNTCTASNPDCVFSGLFARN